jgi:hypothetical protein
MAGTGANPGPRRRVPVHLEDAVARSFEQMTAPEFAGLSALARLVARRIETSRTVPSAALVSALGRLLVEGGLTPRSNLDRAVAAQPAATDEERERALDAAIAEILATE